MRLSSGTSCRLGTREVGDNENHEGVEVPQDECWGILFAPTYLITSEWPFLHGRDGYRANPFENEVCVVDDADS